MTDERLLHRAKTVWRGAIERDDRVDAAGRETRLLQTRGRSRGASGGIPAPVFALALAVIAAVGWTREEAAPREVVDDSMAVSGVPAEIAPVTDGAPLVVARACFGCRGEGGKVNLLPGDRLAPDERVSVPRGSTLILCWSLESADTDSRAIIGPAEVRAGASTAVTTPEGRADPTPTTIAPGPVEDPRGEWRAAQTALRTGDRSNAERRLRALLAMGSVPASLRSQASFALAELDLARGAVDDAHTLLDVIAHSSDPALAADAVFLQARVSPSPSARAALFARYLARRPPSPYREQAMVDEAVARADAGDEVGARALAERVRGMASVPEVVLPALTRLERRLAAAAQ